MCLAPSITRWVAVTRRVAKGREIFSFPAPARLSLSAKIPGLCRAVSISAFQRYRFSRDNVEKMIYYPVLLRKDSTAESQRTQRNIEPRMNTDAHG